MEAEEGVGLLEQEVRRGGAEPAAHATALTFSTSSGKTSPVSRSFTWRVYSRKPVTSVV